MKTEVIKKNEGLKLNELICGDYFVYKYLDPTCVKQVVKIDPKLSTNSKIAIMDLVKGEVLKIDDNDISEVIRLKPSYQLRFEEII